MGKKFEINPKNKQVIDEYIKDFREPNKNIRPKTIKNDIFVLRKLANFLKSKNLKDATEQDLKVFFSTNKDYSGYNLLGIKLTQFYRWVDKLHKKEMPKRMYWFEYEKKKPKDTEQVKQDLITPEEYKLILDNSGRDRFGMWQACWETFYLSGARLGEVASMQIKHVKFKDGKASIYVPESKTKSREIPFCNYPYLLERWINNHPNKEDSESPLWISNSTNNFGDKLARDSIAMIFWKIKKKINIKQNLSVHNFRKTRFTLMSNQRSKDGGLVYSDSQLALFFGWSPKTISDRREQYDLTSTEELKNTVFDQEKTLVQDYDIVKRTKEQLEAKHAKEIGALQSQMQKLEQMLLSETTKLTKLLLNKEGLSLD